MLHKFSKPYMSITELVKETGLSRDYFKGLAHNESYPGLVKWTQGKGKIIFITSRLEDILNGRWS